MVVVCAAVNYVAIANALEVTPSVLAAGLAADNVICAVYFTTLFALGSKIPAESVPPPTTGNSECCFDVRICLIWLPFEEWITEVMCIYLQLRSHLYWLRYSEENVLFHSCLMLILASFLLYCYDLSATWIDSVSEF